MSAQTETPPPAFAGGSSKRGSEETAGHGLQEQSSPVQPALHRSVIVAALGAGRMGRGIAHAFAYAGHDVWLIDIKRRSKAEAGRLKKEAFAEVRTSLEAQAAAGAFEASAIPAILRRIRFAGRQEAPAALARADVVFEGVPEVMAAKHDALAFASAHLGADAIVASTTSTFLVTALSGMLAQPRRFLNAHWLNPAYIIPLVEVSPHAGTDARVLARFNALLRSIGKVPVLCKPAPGFIVPRLQSLVMNEAARMIEEGIATPGDIDRAIRYGFGFRYANMGVVEFIDYGGVDILWFAANYLADHLGERFRPPASVKRLMAQGRKGLREGRGYFDWRNVDIPAYRRQALADMIRMLRHHGLQHPPAAGTAPDPAGRRVVKSPRLRQK